MTTDTSRGGSSPRNKPYAIRVVRLLTKAAVATELGPEVCWLLTVIAGTQDARHYAGPVNFWNEQLMPLCGFGGRSRLVAARNKAVESGWLEYQPGGKGRAGRYRVVIPAQYAGIPDGATDDQDGLPSQNGTTTGRQPDGNRTANRHLPTVTGTVTDSSCSEPSSTKPSEPPPPAPGFDPFPCAGPIKTWTLPAAKLAEWQACYPALDVPAVIRKARQWCMDNPRKRKTAGGMTRFLGGWIATEQDNGRVARRDAPKPKAPAPVYPRNSKEMP